MKIPGAGLPRPLCPAAAIIMHKSGIPSSSICIGIRTPGTARITPLPLFDRYRYPTSHLQYHSHFQSRLFLRSILITRLQSFKTFQSKFRNILLKPESGP